MGSFAFPPRLAKLVTFLKLRAQIRKTKAKTLIYIADRDVWRTIRDVCFFRSCGIRHVVGAPLRRDLRLPRVNSETGETENEAMRLTRCLASLGSIDLNDRSFWDLHLWPDEVLFAERKLAPLGGRDFIAINAGGKVQSKDWGNENWTAFLRMLA